MPGRRARRPPWPRCGSAASRAREGRASLGDHFHGISMPVPAHSVKRGPKRLLGLRVGGGSALYLRRDGAPREGVQGYEGDEGRADRQEQPAALLLSKARDPLVLLVSLAVL